MRKVVDINLQWNAALYVQSDTMDDGDGDDDDDDDKQTHQTHTWKCG